MVFSRRYRFRFGDIDEAGIAYYPTLLHYLHCCMEDWWSDGLGRPYARVLREERIGFPAVHVDADFLAPIRYGDEPEVWLGVLRVGDRSLELGFWMTDGARPLCRARVVTACIDMDSMRPCAVPRHWHAAFEAHAITESEMPPARGPRREPS